MKLRKIKIKNYKSIESVEFNIPEISNSYTYGLLGINESGKSSILKAISLFQNATGIDFPNDYHDDSLPISVSLYYFLEKSDLDELYIFLSTNHGFTKEFLKKIVIEFVELKIETQPDSNSEILSFENVFFKESLFSEYTLKANLLHKKTFSEKELESLNLTTFFQQHLEYHFWQNSHDVTFWEASPEFLLLDKINLNEFGSKPRKISVPLTNCFAIAGIKGTIQIKKEIEKLNSHAKINSLQSRLSKSTTEYIRKVWPEHPISISFQIDNNTISLLVEDDEIEFKPKTAAQRSDGFKQFISFLLTLSIENQTEGLSNTIVLIDEPETHLHPPAQINLLNELIKITSNGKQNILFFATHSNYLIDKDNLDRNYRVIKTKNQQTTTSKIQKKSSSYAEVNFEVFNIPTTDYHNELYGFVELEDKSLLNSFPKKRKWKDSRTNKIKDVSLCEYIRHSIHHPENILNNRFSDKELLDSIKLLRKLKDQIL
jgi:predicted ATP-dependent endonuclease of OLD family